MERSVAVNLKANISGYVGEMMRAEKATKQFATTAKATLGKSVTDLTASEDKLTRSQQKLTVEQGKTAAASKTLSTASKASTDGLKAADAAADKAGKSYQSLGSRIKAALSNGPGLAKFGDASGLSRLSANATKTGREVGGKMGAGLLGVASKFAGPLALAFGAVSIAKGFSKSISLAADFDKSMRLVGTTTGQTGKELKDLTDVAIDMGAKTSFSAQGASDAMLALAKGGLTAAQIKAGALSSTLTLATAGGLGLGEAADFMVQGLSAFGLEADQASEVAAALAGGANASTASVQSMGQALSQVGAQAKVAGLSIQDTTAALAAFDNAGVKGSDAGTSLKTFLQRLVPTTLSAQNAMEQYGLVTVNAKKAFDFLSSKGVKGLTHNQDELNGKLKEYAMRLTGNKSFNTEATKAYLKIATETGSMSNAFFDAAGNIKSVTEVSQVLQDALKGQSKEQKIATLTTLFGSDASRAAAILADNGAKGLAKFVRATNDKTAADELAKSATEGYSGALEKFKGSVETAQIAFGTKFLPLLTKALNYLSDQGMPTLQGIGTIITDTLAPGLDLVSGGFGKFIEYLSTHQADVISAFKTGGDAVLEFAKTVAVAAAGGLRQMGDFALKSTDAVLGMVGAIITGLDSIPGVDMSDSLVEFGKFQASAHASAEAARDGLYEVADGIDKRVIPGLDAMKDRFDESANKQIFSAQQRDAMAATSNAIDKIGTSINGSQIYLDKFSDISKLSADNQRALRNRLNDAQKALSDQIGAAKNAGASQKDLTKTWEDGKRKLYDEFVQMGISKKEAKKLADQYAGIKPKVETKFETPGARDARENTEKLRKEIAALKNKTVDVKVKINASRGKLAAEIYKAGFVPISGPRASDGPGRARGGLISGFTPVSQGDDLNIPMRSGEGVEVSEAMKDPYEVKRLHTMNRRVLAGASPAKVREELGESQDMGHGYARGGVVRVTSRMSGNRPDFNLGEFSSAAASLYGEAARVTAKRAAANYVKKENARIADASGGATAGNIDVNNPTGRTSWGGGTFTNLFAANLRRAEKISGNKIVVIQGGFRPSTSYSGTSHARDAIDTRVNYANLRAMRKVGIATGDRTGLGRWAPHMHAVPTKGAGFGGGSAVWQAQDYLRRGGAKQSPRSPWGLEKGGIVQGGRGGIRALVGEGSRDELVTPLPKNLDLSKVNMTGAVQQPRQIIQRNYAQPSPYRYTGGTQTVTADPGSMRPIAIAVNMPATATPEAAGAAAGGRIAQNLNAQGIGRRN